MSNKRQRKDQNVKVDLPVEINKLSERTLVTVVDTFRIVMESNVSVVKALGEMMKENVHMMGKMVDAMTRLRHTMEDNEREAQKLEDRRREDENGKEVEGRFDNKRWRQEERKGDDRKREADRSEKRNGEEHGRREEKMEKENRPAMKSVVANHNRR